MAREQPADSGEQLVAVIRLAEIVVCAGEQTGDAVTWLAGAGRDDQDARPPLPLDDLVAELEATRVRVEDDESHWCGRQLRDRVVGPGQGGHHTEPGEEVPQGVALRLSGVNDQDAPRWLRPPARRGRGICRSGQGDITRVIDPSTNPVVTRCLPW